MSEYPIQKKLRIATKTDEILKETVAGLNALLGVSYTEVSLIRRFVHLGLAVTIISLKRGKGPFDGPFIPGAVEGAWEEEAHEFAGGLSDRRIVEGLRQVEETLKSDQRYSPDDPAEVERMRTNLGRLTERLLSRGRH